MGRQEPVNVIEQVVFTGDGRDEVDKDDVTADSADTHHFGYCLIRTGEVVQRASTKHHIERLVEERQRLRFASATTR